MPGRLEGRAAVITGAASGIGESTARRFIEEGANVVLGDIQTAPGQVLAAELGDASPRFPPNSGAPHSTSSLRAPSSG
jgi:NAD(P)-dependent dehydrogenase (short-subunit alcohol dehydrogenase family)